MKSQESHMKKYILATAATATLALQAHAADLPRRTQTPKAPMMATTQAWTGFYAGIKAGYGWAPNTKFYSPLAVANANNFAQGALAGLFAGYNHQYNNNVVLGIETEMNITGIRGMTTCPNPIARCGENVNWLGATRLRAGYAFDQWLPFIAAGASYSGIRVETRDLFVARASEKARLGWNVGAGLEYAFTSNVSVRAEYTYHSFSARNYIISTVGETAKNRTNIHVGSIGISYKF